jgi:hypothetical protein
MALAAQEKRVPLADRKATQKLLLTQWPWALGPEEGKPIRLLWPVQQN